MTAQHLRNRHALDLDTPALADINAEVSDLLTTIADRKTAERDRRIEAGIKPTAATVPGDLAGRVVCVREQAERAVREAPEAAHLTVGGDVLEYAVLQNVANRVHDTIRHAGGDIARAGILFAGDVSWADDDTDASYAARRTQARRAATVTAKRLARQILAALPDDDLTVGLPGLSQPEPAQPWRYIFRCGYHAWSSHLGPSPALTAEAERLLR